MSNNSEGASTSSASSSRGHVHFTMTVKVDIGGHTSATATASASGAAAIHSSSSSSSSGSSSSTSTICAAAAAAATATAASTQDLLLKLQPLLPHLCLPPPASQQQQQQQQQQHEHHQHQQEDRRSEHHESGLELSLGLSCFNQPSGASTSPALDVEQELLQCEEPVSVPATLDKGAVGFELANANVGDGGRGGAAGAAGGGQQQQQQPLPSGLVRSDSLPVNWRVLEEQRLKREVQCQKRQEARKKRRILIDEQKQQRRKNSGTPKKVVVKDEVVEQHDDVQPSTCPDRKSSGRGSRSGRSHSHPGYSKRSKKSSTASGSVKVEAQEEDTTATATPTTCTTVGTSTSFSSVIRPSPVHEHKNEWFDKLLEMRKSIDPKPDDNEEQTREEMSNSQQCSTSVSSSSSIARAVASGSLACPVTSSTLTTISAIEPQTPHRVVTSSFRGDHGDHVPRLPPPPPPPPLTPPPSLLRSVSLGTFRDQQEQQQQRSSIGSTSTSTSTLRAPSPVRCSNSSLMRTLSEGAAMRSSLSLSADSWNKRSSKISAFKSPRKEQLQQVNGAIGWGGRASSTVSEAATGSSSGAASDLPWVTTTGTGPNGKTVTGVLFAYKKGEVKIVCACHGQHMTAKQFVEHAGGVDVTNPEKCIVVSPVKRNMAVAPAPTSTI